MDTLVGENYLFDNTLNKSGSDADTYLVKQKNLTGYIDQQRGQGDYTSGKVIIDAQSGNTTDVNDWSNAYITLPYLYKLSVNCTTGAASSIGAYDPNYLLAPKNCSLIESMRVEQGGRVVIEDCSNLSHLVSFRKHQTTSATSLGNDTGDIYYPDGEFSESITASIAGVRNVSNCPITVSTNAPNTFYNNGALMRQRQMIGNNRITTFVSAASSTNEQAPYQAATVQTALTAATETTLSEVHYLAIIKLSDLSDYFATHPLAKGGYKFTFSINSGISIMTTTADAATSGVAWLAKPLTLTATSLIGSATVQPCMATIGGTNCVNSTSVVAQTTNTVYRFTLTSKVDTTSDARQSGVQLWIPSLTLSDKDEAKLLSQPIIHRTPFMINSSVYQNQGAGAPINLQLFNAISNPRAVIIIPQYSSAVGSQTQPSQCSPLNPCPGVTDPLSIQRIQLRLNTKPILPAPINYGWNAFVQNTSQLFTANGGLDSNGAINTGMINLSRFMNNYRYYAFDVSLTSADQRDIPQMITLEGLSGSSVSMDLYVFVLYEQDVTFNIQNATVQVGTA